MTASTVTQVQLKARTTPPQMHWQTILVWLLTLVLFTAGIWMRLHDLGLPFDRDGYDEGVYWQSLRAMSASHPLYQSIFYSQPPFFLLSIYPLYLLLGQTLWAARLGMAAISLFGLVGAWLLGKALAGRIGAITALFLLVTSPLYLTQSQTIQAEAPSTAFSLLAVGLAYLWWEKPDGLAGLSLAALATTALALGILSKLLAVSALAPFGLLLLAHLWRIFQKKPGTRLASARSLLVGIGALLFVTVLVLLPFVSSIQPMWQDVMTFHTDAGVLLKSTPQQSNLSLMKPVLMSITTYAALYGTTIALLRRDWRVLPLLAWLLTTIYMLWKLTPLFPHHLVALIPPLIALTVMGISPFTWQKKPSRVLLNSATAVALALILVTATLNVQQIRHYYRNEQAQNMATTTPQETQIIKDLQRAIQPNQRVITDAQFLVSLADRNTPAALVDTSQVRINAGYVTVPQLIQEASQPQVRAILFYSGRLNIKSVAGFHTWVLHHFHLLHSYGAGRELWIKI